jgi:hypothetical protein
MCDLITFQRMHPDNQNFRNPTGQPNQNYNHQYGIQDGLPSTIVKIPKDSLFRTWPTIAGI